MASPAQRLADGHPRVRQGRVCVHTCAAFGGAARSRRLRTPSPPALAQPQPLWRIELLLDPAPTSRSSSSSSSMLLSFARLRAKFLRRGASDKGTRLPGWRRQARTDHRASFLARQCANDLPAITVRVAPELAGGATGAAPEPGRHRRRVAVGLPFAQQQAAAAAVPSGPRYQVASSSAAALELGGIGRRHRKKGPAVESS
jgi:hypothetical protein